MDWQIQLISLYVYVHTHFEKELSLHYQRMSNNHSPEFTDVEVITIYLFGIIRQRFDVKAIHRYTKDHLSDWFPRLPSYEAYNARLNHLSELFPTLTERIIADAPLSNVLYGIRLIDSMPIIMASAKRSQHAKVASHFANKGYCASKGIYFYGVKVHILGFKRHQTLPVPEYIGLTPATDHDLNAFRLIADLIENSELYADKAYRDEMLMLSLATHHHLEMKTPFKKDKGQIELDCFEKLLSTAVNRVRQPIESLFNWIQEKTHIQIASKVRSYNGLLVHVFGRLAAAMYIMAFNS